MTDIFAPAITPAPTAEEPGDRRAPRALPRLAGAGILVFPFLLMGGMLTSPPQTEPGSAGYIASLAADPALSLVSANLLHYAWVLVALCLFGVFALVGRRGRVWVSIAAVASVFGAIQLSGLLLSDWFLIGAGSTLTLDQAVAMNAAAREGSAAVWLLSAQIGAIVGLVLLSLGLARARVVSWWIAPLPLLAFVLPFFDLGLIAAIAFVPLMAPYLVTGWKLVRR